MADGLTWEPGWFPDPTGRHDHRWWDGLAWTAHVADAGVAGRDPLDPLGAASTTAARGMHDDGGTASDPGRRSRVGTDTTDAVAIVALVVAILSVLLAILPLIGLVPAVVGLVLAIVARSRLRRTGHPGEGIATAALVTAIVALLIAIVVTSITVAVLGGAGGGLSEVFREYAACLESNSQAECRALLEQSINRMVG
jgi:hypothetical protein